MSFTEIKDAIIEALIFMGDTDGSSKDKIYKCLTCRSNSIDLS